MEEKIDKKGLWVLLGLEMVKLLVVIFALVAIPATGVVVLFYSLSESASVVGDDGREIGAYFPMYNETFLFTRDEYFNVTVEECANCTLGPEEWENVSSNFTTQRLGKKYTTFR